MGLFNGLINSDSSGNEPILGRGDYSCCCPADENKDGCCPSWQFIEIIAFASLNLWHIGGYGPDGLPHGNRPNFLPRHTVVKGAVERAREILNQCCIKIIFREPTTLWSEEETDKRLQMNPRYTFLKDNNENWERIEANTRLGSYRGKVKAFFIPAVYGRSKTRGVEQYWGGVAKQGGPLVVAYGVPYHNGNNTYGFDIMQMGYILAHEIGHVLGLGHVNDPARLMYSWDESPMGYRTGAELLIPSECGAMRKSKTVRMTAKEWPGWAEEMRSTCKQCEDNNI